MIRHYEIINKDGRTLRGYLTIPEEFCGTLVLMYHGFTGNKTEHGGLFRDFSRLLSENHIGSLRMDFAGNGESDGSFCDFTFDTLISDANLMLDAAKTVSGVTGIALMGYSMGGAVAALIGANHSDAVDKILLWSPAGNMCDIIRNVFEQSEKLENGNANYPNFEISKAMAESASRYTMYDRLERFKNKVLIIHGRKDPAVNYLYGIRYSVSFPDSHLCLLDNAGHGYDRREDKAELFAKSLEFLKGENV
jgi:pimeloyl-ACP methyl ester carboxylesterase